MNEHRSFSLLASLVSPSFTRPGALFLALGLAACSVAACGGSGDATSGSGGAGGDGATSTTASGTGGADTTTGSTTTSSSGTGGSSGCTLAQDTTATSVVNATGCHVLDRDASACLEERKAQGLGGFWLEFSCRVILTDAADVVKAEADGQPDYPSDYFPSDDACYEAYPEGIHNPNEILPKTRVMQFPHAPDQNAGKMMGAIVGIALNGVPIFGDFAAPGDDIYQEAKTFDRCGGHPQMSGTYHYHAEPGSLSYDDSRFIGVMRDGYPIYGRKEQDGSYPASLDMYGGHTGTTAHSNGAMVYHYHVNEQTSMNAGTAGQKQWFLTTGSYRGTPAACSSCN